MEKLQNEESSLPGINTAAPDFTALTTAGEISLSDYSGEWLVLFSHPSDFTPVCTTEFVAFAENNEQFAELNTNLLGLSIDSVYSHIAWVRNIEKLFGIKIPFPVIADLGMEVANKYGMIQPGVSDTSAVRAVFIIDEQSIIRAIIYYPPQVGRNIYEILRLVKALQISDKNRVATPANWQPGDKVIVPAPQTTTEAEKRLESGYQCKDWYFCKKQL